MSLPPLQPLQPKRRSDDDEWNTGLDINDENHYWNKDTTFDTGLFLNRATARQINKMRELEKRHNSNLRSIYLSRRRMTNRAMFAVFVFGFLVLSYCIVNILDRTPTNKSVKEKPAIERPYKPSPGDRYTQDDSRY